MNTNSNRPILVIITSSDCSSCIPFKKEVLPGLRSRLTMVEPVIIELKGRDKSPLASYPSDLSRHLHWYPLIMLIDRNLWNQNSALHPIIFNGKMGSDGNYHYKPSDPDSYPRTASGIVNWINSYVKVDSPTVVVTQSGRPINSYSTNVQRLKSQKSYIFQ